MESSAWEFSPLSQVTACWMANGTAQPWDSVNLDRWLCHSLSGGEQPGQEGGEVSQAKVHMDHLQVLSNLDVWQWCEASSWPTPWPLWPDVDAKLALCSISGCTGYSTATRYGETVYARDVLYCRQLWSSVVWSPQVAVVSSLALYGIRFACQEFALILTHVTAQFLSVHLNGNAPWVVSQCQPRTPF